MSIRNLLDLLVQAANNGAGKGVLTDNGNGNDSSTLLTYEQLLVLAQLRSTQLLQRVDVDIKYQVILLYAADHLESITWFWAIIVAGAVPCICPPLPKDEEQRRQRIAHLRTLLGDPLVITNKSLASDFDGVQGLRVSSTSELESVQVEQRPSQGEESLKGSSKTEQDLAVLMLTSGSTSNPKAVCLKHGQLLAALKGKSLHHGTSHNDIFMNWIGLDHVANLTQIHLHAVSLAANQLHLSGAEVLANPLGFLESISKHKITMTFAPNFFLATLVSRLKATEESLPNLDLSSLRALLSGGESNVVDTCDQLTRMLAQYGTPNSFISPGFGMTETCAGSIHALDCPSYDLAQGAEFCSVGVPIQGLRMRIIRHDGTEAGKNEIGSLEVSGPVVFSGYYNDPKGSDGAFTPDGWFKTGDVGLIDSNGSLRLTGRNKDSVVINGVNYSSESIETAIGQAAIPGVAPSFTVVWAHRPKNSPTETLCIAYLPTYSPENTQSRLTTAASVSKAVVKYCGTRPFKIIALPAALFPKSSLGKLSRSKMQRAFQEGAYLGYEQRDTAIMETSRKNIGEAAGTTATEKVVLQVFHDLLASDYGELAIGIRIDSDMFDIGVSSIDLLKLRVYLEKALDIDIPMTIFSPIRKALDGLQKEKTYDPITVLQAHGTKIPIFLIHPGLGEILIFMNLARCIEDRPVYAIRARGFDGEKFFSSVEEMVTTYHDAIKRVQPTGPYAIIGHSFGSIMAFEITKIMEANHDQVQFLATIDQPPHFKWWARLTDWNYAVLTISYYMNLIDADYQSSALPEMQKRTHEDVLTHIMERAGPARVNEAGMSPEYLKNWATLAHEMKVIAREYDPTERVATMDVFHVDPVKVAAANLIDPDAEWPHEDMRKWEDFAEDIRFHVVPGGHSTLIRQPNVPGLYKVLKKAWEKRGLE
ncbi:NRPS-like protein [Penicillium canescens]|nr:NRPS-like protein [Penicillium canescens]